MLGLYIVVRSFIHVKVISVSSVLLLSGAHAAPRIKRSFHEGSLPREIEITLGWS